MKTTRVHVEPTPGLLVTPALAEWLAQVHREPLTGPMLADLAVWGRTSVEIEGVVYTARWVSLETAEGEGPA